MRSLYFEKIIALVIGYIAFQGAVFASETKSTQIIHGAADFRVASAAQKAFEANRGAFTLKKTISSAIYVSPVLEGTFPFNAVGAHWNADLPGKSFLRVSLRASADGASWGNWLFIPSDESPVTKYTESGEVNPFAGDIVGALAFFDSDRRFVQYRVEFFRGDEFAPDLRRLALQIIRSSDGPDIETILQKKENEALQHATKGHTAIAKVEKPSMVKRADWGAQAPRYNYSYTIVKHIAFHHTAGVSDYNVSTLDDCAARVRAIQSYHRNTLGWNDIGYAYAICKQGHIFQAREDDNDNHDVYGAHDSHNAGSQGIANLGYFHPPYNHQPTPELLNALYRLIAWKCDERNIDPQGKSLYAAYGGTVDHIYGHQEVRATACPGDGLFALKQSIKDSVEAIIEKVATAITDEPLPVPEKFTIMQSYPNPFTPGSSLHKNATIQISLQHPAFIQIAVHNILGQAVRKLYQGAANTGERHFLWDGTDDAGQFVPPGVYFYRLSTEQNVRIKKVLVLMNR